jgi:hypothetical protein
MEGIAHGWINKSMIVFVKVRYVVNLTENL